MHALPSPYLYLMANTQVCVELSGRKLQWGRNFFVTEIRIVPQMHRRITAGFNGAVTFSLRKFASDRSSSFFADDSPETFELGFNGAVTFSLRKSQTMLTPYDNDLRFNGAVTFSLRKSRQYTTAQATAEAKLQWGRNFFVTEIHFTLRLLQKEGRELQWGRNFFVTEIGIAEYVEMLTDRLQWGRNFFVTEIGTAWQKARAIEIASMGP